MLLFEIFKQQLLAVFGAQLVLYPAVVQGVHAVSSILKNLDLVEQSDADVVIIGRGGGSAEDLWAFNEEPV